MEKIINPNYALLRYAHDNGYRGCVLEGGSRSGKTYSSIQFQLDVAAHAQKKLVFNNIRESYNSFKTTLFDDYDNILQTAGHYSPFHKQEVPSFWLCKSKVNFIGADKVGKVHGMGCDYFYINEALEGIDKIFFDNFEQRCRIFWWLDYNPSSSDHWIFDLEKRPDVLFVRTTILDNPFVSQHEKNKILSYDPNNVVNIKNGTADDYMWKVYGLGLRASPEGLVFKDVTYIEEFPDDVEQISYGIDFGESNETAIVKNGLKIIDGIYNLYTKKMFYTPTETSLEIIEAIKALGIDTHIWCDNNKPGWVSDLRAAGIAALPTKKFDGSRDYWISSIKKCKIHIVRDVNFKKEQENFKYRVVDGIQLSETIKKYDHLWSACGYSVVGDFRQYMS